MGIYGQQARKNPGGGGGGGGTSTKPKQPKNQGLHLPPFLASDPSIEAERRANQRGLKDILKDTHRAQRYATEDYATKTGDIGRAFSRGTQDIGAEVAGINLRQARGTEDFTNNLTNLIRGFQVKGREQTQAANAAGVLDSSTAQAAAGRRAENLAIARQPLDLGLARLNEDTQLGLGRAGLAGSRLGEDTSREYGLAAQDIGRTRLDLATKKRRAIREQRISNIDLINQEIFSARQLKPGAFTTTGLPKNKRKR
jgi:hypothetical protein